MNCKAEERLNAWLEKYFKDGYKNLPFSFLSREKLISGSDKEWRLVDTEHVPGKDKELERITVKEPATGLEVTFEKVEYKKHPAVEWVVYLHNTGNKDTPAIENLKAIDASFSCEEGHNFILHHSRGDTCDKRSYEPISDELYPYSCLRLSCVGGRSSNGTDCATPGGRNGSMPFFNLESSEEGGIIFAVGWSGQWIAEFRRDDKNNVEFSAGMEETHFVLHPGEKVRTPRILMFFWDGFLIDAQNKFRRFILDHHTPLVNGKPFQYPIAVLDWFRHLGTGVTEKNQKETIKRYIEDGIPVDYYWLDAGWYGENDKILHEGHSIWWQNVGNWYPNSERFPNGIKPVADEAKKHNLGFVMWFELERVSLESKLYREHPDWVIRPDSDMFGKPWQAKQDSRSGLLKLNNKEVVDWAIEYASSMIKELRIDVFRVDFNIDPLKYWQDEDEPDRRGITEIRYIEGLYRLWDTLRDRFPGVVIDNCSSGGRRIDLETISRSVSLWRCDYTAEPDGVQSLMIGLSRYIPCSGTAVFTFDSYLCRSRFQSSIAIDIHPPSSEYDPEIARKRIAELRLLQPLYSGNFYELTSYSTASDVWCAYQIERRDLNLGAVVLFRRSQSPHPLGIFKLMRLQTERNYEICDIDSGKKVVKTGSELMENGIEVEIPIAPGSVILTYSAICP